MRKSSVWEFGEKLGSWSMARFELFTHVLVVCWSWLTLAQKNQLCTSLPKLVLSELMVIAYIWQW